MLIVNSFIKEFKDKLVDIVTIIFERILILSNIIVINMLKF